MLVKHLSKNTFDVFFNKGWENWARFEVQGKQLSQVGGVPQVWAETVLIVKEKARIKKPLLRVFVIISFIFFLLVYLLNTFIQHEYQLHFSISISPTRQPEI